LIAEIADYYLSYQSRIERTRTDFSTKISPPG